MGSARRRRKREVEEQVSSEQYSWGSFWFTDRVSKKTGRAIRKFWIGPYGEKHLYAPDHRGDPYKLRIEDRVLRLVRPVLRRD